MADLGRLSSLERTAKLTLGAQGVAGPRKIIEQVLLKVLVSGVGSRELAVAHNDDGVYAMDNSCPHAGGPLGDTRLKEGCFVECPWHNSVFDARTGAVVRGPARKEVKLYDLVT